MHIFFLGMLRLFLGDKNEYKNFSTEILRGEKDDLVDQKLPVKHKKHKIRKSMVATCILHIQMVKTGVYP